MIMRSNSPKALRLSIAAVMAGLLAHASVTFAITDPLTEAQRLLQQGQPAAALEKVDAYIASRPRDPQGPFLKGLILMDLGNQSEALAVFTKLNEDYPELPEPYNNLAVLYAEQRQYERARVTLEMAIRADPSYAIARENLGDVYAKLASESYGQALQLDPASKITPAKLAKLGELNLAAATAVGKQAAVTPAAGEKNKTARADSATLAATPPMVAAAARPAVKPASRTAAAAPATSPKPASGLAQAGKESIGEAPPVTSAIPGDNAPMVTEEARGVAGKGWDLIFSPYTYHYSYSSDHKPVVLLGLTKGLEGRWLAGGAVFSNSFGQPSAFLFGGQRYVSPFGFENWYLQWTAGLLYGYVGEYQDKVPFNHNGFSPGLVASIGYQFNRYVYAELDVLGGAGLMFSLVFPLPKDWP
jgi:Flp pilus assembly protein TadD